MAEIIHLFGARHWVALSIIFSIDAALIGFRFSRYKKLHFFFRYGLVVVLVVSELVWYSWKIVLRDWSLPTMLPLELCGIMTYVSIAALTTKNEKLYPFCYFFGISGGLTTSITPVKNFDFPDFIFIQTMAIHGALIATGVYIVAVEKYYPKLKDVFYSFLVLNIYGLVIFVINVKINSNYFFLIEKPSIPSLLDVFPDWPWYVFYGDFLSFFLLLLLYSPFAFQRKFLQPAYKKQEKMYRRVK